MGDDSNRRPQRSAPRQGNSKVSLLLFAEKDRLYTIPASGDKPAAINIDMDGDI